MTLKTTIFGLDLKNPLILAAGILGVSHSTMIRAFHNGASCVTSKSISKESKTGHANPTVIAYQSGLINAVGLSNPGIEEYIKEIKKVKEQNIPLILNTIGDTPEEMALVAVKGEEAGVDIIEINPSCPNVIHKMPYYCNPNLLFELTEKVKNSVKIPVIVKLSPNSANIANIAKSAEDAGADGITAINTVGPGMMIDVQSKKPILDFKTGGISGPAIKPIAIRCVYEIYKEVEIPIIGVGGVTYGKDAIEMMMAGATLIGIGSGVYYRGIDIFNKVANEIAEWLKNNGYSDSADIVGIAHD